MEKKELRRRAWVITEIPDNFHLEIEDYFEGENGEGEAMFFWSSQETDEGITICLDYNGNLIDLSIDLHRHYEDITSISEEACKERAERYLLKFYPNALKELTFYRMKRLDDAYRFYYERFVMDIPLDDAGSFIDIDPKGNVVRFFYRPIKEKPEIPTIRISKDKLIEHVKSRLNFRLQITNLFTDVHDVAKDGLYLVYEPDPSFMNYKADVSMPTLSIIHDEEEPETFVPLDSISIASDISKEQSVEDIIGITDEMEIIREVDMGDETGVVWRNRNWEPESHDQDLSVGSYFKRYNEDTVKAFISKKTGKVRSFMWLNERSGNLHFTREECFQKAVNFLSVVLPGYHNYYLQLIVRGDDGEIEEVRKREVFLFQLNHSTSIPIFPGIIMVAVNGETGQIDHYTGPSFDIEQLSQIPGKPTLSKDEAKTRFLNQLDFKLTWSKDYEGDTESFQLVYQACDKLFGTPIRYIDALTGAVITEKEI